MLTPEQLEKLTKIHYDMYYASCEIQDAWNADGVTPDEMLELININNQVVLPMANIEALLSRYGVLVD